MMKKNFFRQSLYLKLGIALLLYITTLLVLTCYFPPGQFITLFGAIGSSIFASVIVGVFFQFLIKEEISGEHLEIMNYLEEKNHSGIIKYYANFKDCMPDIRQEFLNTKSVDIYLIEGNTMLNTLSQDLTYLLSQTDAKVNIYLMSKENPFLEGYGSLWGSASPSYSKEGILSKIESSIEILRTKQKHLEEQGSLKAEFHVYMIKKSLVAYSYYKFDSKIYFVPSKHIASKEFIPFTIVGAKTGTKTSIYSRCEDELLQMHSSSAFEELKLKDEHLLS